MRQDIRATCVLALALLASSALAADQPPERAETLVVYGDDPCPQGESDEIVVCARKPESERYRIPKELREEGNAPMETSLATRMAVVEELTRDTWGAGCSVVGSAGLTGCFGEMMRRWQAERRGAPSVP